MKKYLSLSLFSIGFFFVTLVAGLPTTLLADKFCRNCRAEEWMEKEKSRGELFLGFAGGGSFPSVFSVAAPSATSEVRAGYTLPFWGRSFSIVGNALFTDRHAEIHGISLGKTFDNYYKSDLGLLGVSLESRIFTGLPVRPYFGIGVRQALLNIGLSGQFDNQRLTPTDAVFYRTGMGVYGGAIFQVVNYLHLFAEVEFDYIPSIQYHPGLNNQDIITTKLGFQVSLGI